MNKGFMKLCIIHQKQPKRAKKKQIIGYNKRGIEKGAIRAILGRWPTYHNAHYRNLIDWPVALDRGLK